MKKALTFSLLALFLSACDDDIQLPVGFEHVAVEGNAHFVYVAPEYWGDKSAQRTAGRIICIGLYEHENYCEVYYYGNRNEVPTKFPMVNRKSMIGLFEMKNGKIKFKPLSPVDNDNITETYEDEE